MADIQWHKLRPKGCLPEVATFQASSALGAADFWMNEHGYTAPDFDEWASPSITQYAFRCSDDSSPILVVEFDSDFAPDGPGCIILSVSIEARCS